jgi:hypothetical protein
MNLIKALAFTAAVLLTGCDQSGNKSNAVATDALQPVYTVDSVTLERPADFPNALIVKASGTVRTSGWSNGQLMAAHTAVAPDTVTYKFVAVPPPKDTNSTQAAQPIDATVRLDHLAPEVKAVRVVAETNQTTSGVATNESPAPPATAPPALDQSQPPVSSPPPQ